ncbi:MAG: MDR family NADPH-dependent oxidoreductase [Akkermansiaceae bacterium]
MKAIFTQYGSPLDVIKLQEGVQEEVQNPLQKGEVSVQLCAAPINPADINLIQGTYGIKPELPATAGLEGCGIVTESLSNNFKTGDKVIFTGRAGTWTDSVNVPDHVLLKIPQETPPQQAAMLKVNPLTAWCLLTQLRVLPEGSWIIQNAANSGVGHCVIQIAKLIGLNTINLVRREELIPELDQLGGTVNLLDTAESIDLIREKEPALAFNAVGGDSALRLMDALAVQGFHITYGAMSGRSLKVPNKFLIFKRIQLHGFWVTEWVKEQPKEIVNSAYQMLARWMAEGTLAQPIDSTFPLEEIHAALSRAMTNQRNGKVLIVPHKK